MRRTVLLAIALLLVPMTLGFSPVSSAFARQAVQATPALIFAFETNEFWLNLHHFLYVLGRAQAKMGDASAPPVASAPRDANRGMATLADSERRTWTES